MKPAHENIIFSLEALRHLPIGLENVNDANVDDQSLSFGVTTWYTTHAGRRSEKQQVIIGMSCVAHTNSASFLIELTGLQNPKLPFLEPPPELTPSLYNTDFSVLAAAAGRGSRRPLTPHCLLNCPRHGPDLDWPGPCCGYPATDCSP